jgi:outer membrane protein OmpA-like peptidoglycan-associated protein
LDPGFVDTEFGDLPDLFPNDDLSPPLAGPTPAPPEVAAPGPEPPEVGLPAVAEPATTVPEISAPDHAEPVMAAPESPEPGIEPPTISAPVIASPETASPEAGPVETGQAETGQAESAQPASPSESAPASVSESASTAGGEDITNLDVGGMVEALKAKDWAELHVGDSLYVWLGDELYRRLEDGSLEPTGSVLSPNDTSLDEEGREWLITNDDGSVSISVSLKVWATINFAYNSSDILPESESVLETFSQALKRPALLDKRLLISGHTDSTGTDLFNMGLSRRRAASVAQWLVEKGGLNPDRLILSGYGARMPISDNETDEGRAINRRVEFILLN